MSISHPVDSVHWILDEFDYDEEKYPLITLACGETIEEILRFTNSPWNWRRKLTTWDRQAVTCPACKAVWEYIEAEIEEQSNASNLSKKQ